MIKTYSQNMYLENYIKIDDLTQGSQDWHLWRKSIIGASDAPVIMGENPWKSVEILIKEKLGEVQSFKGNAATRRGANLEPVARSIYCDIKNSTFVPTVIQSKIFPWQGASLDGIDSANNIVEIKCGEKSHLYTAKTGMVPRYYYAQLQHILSITGLSSIDYFSYQPNHYPILICVPRDDAYIKNMLVYEFNFANQLFDRGHALLGFENRNISIWQKHNLEVSESTYEVTSLPNIGTCNNDLPPKYNFTKDENGDVYIGQYFDNRPNGKGVQYWEEGSKLNGCWYCGDFKDGLKDGKGVYNWLGGKKYIGDWVLDKQQGVGILIDEDEGIYIGDFLNGVRHGIGRLIFNNGITYVGGWIFDKRNGKGKTIFHDGSYYDGEYKDDLMHGYGVLQDGDERYEGFYNNGLKCGHGKYLIKDGLYYLGSFDNDEFHGDGKCIWTDGSSYTGAWFKGRPNGVGLYVTSYGTAYEGLWKNGFSISLFREWVKSELNLFHDSIFQIESLSMGCVSKISQINSIFSSNQNHVMFNALAAESKILLSDINNSIDEFIDLSTKKLFDSHCNKSSSRPYCCNQDGYDDEFNLHISNSILHVANSIVKAKECCRKLEEALIILKNSVR